MTADVSQILRYLPESYRASSEVLACFVTAQDAAQDAASSMLALSTVGGAMGAWLTLLARGYGVVRTTGETDVTLQRRLRNVEDKLTKASILASVNDILSSYTASQASVVEWFEEDGAFWADYDFCDDGRLLGEWNTFYLLLPLVGEVSWGDWYVDSGHADDATSAYLGAGPDSPVYASIVAEVDRLRAAGVRYLLITE